MTNQEKKIIDNVVKINVNYKNVNFSNLEKESTTFILTDWKVQIQDSNTFKSIEEYYNLHKDDLDKNDIIVNKNTISIKQSFDLKLLKIDEDNNEEKIKLLRKVIETYFLEKGNNLHLIMYKQTDTKLNDNYNYNVCLNLINEDNRKDKINDFLESNKEFKKPIFFILANKKDEKINSDNLFYLECNNNRYYLSHTAAYLNNLSLSSITKDYCYTKTNSIIPEIVTKIVTDKQKWIRNYIVNIGRKGVVLGGELSSGENLVNTFMIMLLEKRLKIELFNLLTLKYNKSEIQSQLNNIITNELNNFYNIEAIESGFYREKDYSINYNNYNFKVINQNEYLNKGYKLYIVDILKISEEDNKNHKMTPVVIVLNMQKQIRFIELDMEII